MNWIAERTTNAYTVSSEPAEQTLTHLLLDYVYNSHLSPDITQNEARKFRGRLLAAAFDLLVAAEYYRSVGHMGWVYCPFPEAEPMIYYPYTNVCPRCLLQKQFHFHQANKPPSGSIGAMTSKLLTAFLRALFVRHGRNIEILKGTEPVDSIFVDRTVEPPVCLFAEVKSAPLVTLPLAMMSERLTTEEDAKVNPIVKTTKCEK